MVELKCQKCKQKIKAQKGKKPRICKKCQIQQRKETAKKYYEANQNKIKQQRKKYREQNREKIKQSQQRWQQTRTIERRIAKEKLIQDLLDNPRKYLKRA